MSDMTKAELVRENIFLKLEVNKLRRHNRNLVKACKTQKLRACRTVARTIQDWIKVKLQCAK